MSLYVLTVESQNGCEVIGAFVNEKEAKAKAADFVSEGSFKKKISKNNEAKKLMFLDEANNTKVYINVVDFDMPNKKVTKAKKDPKAPKKNLSAFMIFSNQVRNTIKGENPELSFGEIGRKVGEQWKALDDKDKKAYQKKAEEDKKRYEKEMENYNW